MSSYKIQPVAGLHDISTGALIGFYGADGREYLLPVSAAFAANPQAGTAYPGNFTTLTANAAVTLNPANAAVSLAPSGTGNATFGPSGTGTGTLQRINALTVVTTDSSGTPGNATNNNLSGRAAFAAAASTCVITNSQVTAASKVFVSLGGSDATLTSVRVTAGAGSFTVTGNAAATGTTPFDFLVVN